MTIKGLFTKPSILFPLDDLTGPEHFTEALPWQDRDIEIQLSG